MKRCLIVGAGDFARPERLVPRPGDLLIAADGGLAHLNRLGLKPDLLVADFDSLSGPGPVDVPLLRFPTEKDDTDTGIAIAEGRRRGYERFWLYGGIGGREDHTFANLQALVGLARSGLRGFLVGNDWLATAICRGSLELNALKKGFVSVFAADSRCEGVDIEGLKYPLKDAVLTNDYPLGVSNELIGRPARISAREGALLIFCPLEAVTDE